MQTNAKKTTIIIASQTLIHAKMYHSSNPGSVFLLSLLSDSIYLLLNGPSRKLYWTENTSY